MSRWCGAKGLVRRGAAAARSRQGLGEVAEAIGGTDPLAVVTIDGYSPGPKTNTVAGQSIDLPRVEAHVVTSVERCPTIV